MGLISDPSSTFGSVERGKGGDTTTARGYLTSADADPWPGFTPASRMFPAEENRYMSCR